MPAFKPPKGVVLVRCLGPGPEHTFLSRDRKAHRICKACVEKLKDCSRMMAEGPTKPDKD
jgi:hypothetical protein